MAENTEKEKPQPKTISELVFIGISENGIHGFCVGSFRQKSIPPRNIIKGALIQILYT